MVRLMQNDAVRYPVAPVQGLRAPKMDKFSDEELEAVCTYLYIMGVVPEN